MINAIIFDLGGVIINIDYSRTAQAFRALGANNFDEIYSQSKQIALFDDFETGKISNSVFRAGLQDMLNICVTDEAFDAAWNAMLGDLPFERIEALRSLKTAGYSILLFSNTNAIHLEKVNQILLEQTGLESLDGEFEACYYSHLCGYRKPHVASFNTILAMHDLTAVNVLFIDDSRQHIEGAKQAGITTIHLTPEKSIFMVERFLEAHNSTELTLSLEQTNRLSMV